MRVRRTHACDERMVRDLSAPKTDRQSRAGSTHDSSSRKTIPAPDGNEARSTERILIEGQLIEPSDRVRSRECPDHSTSPAVEDRGLPKTRAQVNICFAFERRE